MKYKLFLIGSLYLSFSGFLIGSDQHLAPLVAGQIDQEQVQQKTARQRLGECWQKIRCHRPDGTSSCTRRRCIAATLLALGGASMVVVCSTNNCGSSTWML